MARSVWKATNGQKLGLTRCVCSLPPSKAEDSHTGEAGWGTKYQFREESL